MYFEVEPSGCCERKGLIQVRYCFYLEPGDHDYHEHNLIIPDLSNARYAGPIDANGEILDQDDYQKWLDTLPKKTVKNPFHNHFAYFTSDVTDKEIVDFGKSFLDASYRKWCKGEFPNIRNLSIPVPTETQKAQCQNRVNQIKVSKFTGAIDK